MRAYEGQHSDSRPIRRSPAEMRKQLADIEEHLGRMKSHTSPDLRKSMAEKAAELRRQLQEIDTQAATEAALRQLRSESMPYPNRRRTTTPA